MGGQDDLRKSLEAIRAAMREEQGEPPTPEELLAYRDGRLDPAERRRVEAGIAVHPEAARALADLASFPDVEAAPGTLEPTDDEIGARWQAFRQRLAEVPAPRVPAERGSAALAIAAPRSARRRPFPRLAAVAAVALVAGGAGFLAGRASRDLPAAAINVDIVELTPLAEGGARSATTVERPEESEELVLVLGLDEEERFPEYQVKVVDREGGPVWARSGLRPTSLGTFHLSFRRGALEPGTYRIHLFGREGEGWERLATYELRLLSPRPGRE